MSRVGCCVAATLSAAVLLFMIMSAVDYAFIIENSPYPLLGRAVILVKAFVPIALFAFLGIMVSKWSRHCVTATRHVLEWVAICLILGVSALLRTLVVIEAGLPILEGSEGQWLFEIGGHVANGTLRTDGAFYCDFLARQPSYIGYAFWVLAPFMRVFGADVSVMYNASFGMGIIATVLAWLAGRQLGGQRCGLWLGALMALWPEFLLLGLLNTGDLCTVCVFFGILALIGAVKRRDQSSLYVRKPLVCVLMLIVLGLVMGLSRFVAMPLVFLWIPVVIALLMRPDGKPVKTPGACQLMLGQRVLSIVIVGMTAFLTSTISGESIKLIIGLTPASAIAQMGGNAMMGANTSGGTWNEADSAMLDDLYKNASETDAVNAAHISQVQAMEEALRRWREQGKEIVIMDFSDKLTALYRENTHVSGQVTIQAERTGASLMGLTSALLKERDQASHTAYIIVLVLALLCALRQTIKPSARELSALFMFLSMLAYSLLMRMQIIDHALCVAAMLSLSALSLAHMRPMSESRLPVLTPEPVAPPKPEDEQELPREKKPQAYDILPPPPPAFSNREDEYASSTPRRGGHVGRVQQIEQSKDNPLALPVHELLKEGHLQVTASQAYLDGDTAEPGGFFNMSTALRSGEVKLPSLDVSVRAYRKSGQRHRYINLTRMDFAPRYARMLKPGLNLEVSMLELICWAMCSAILGANTLEEIATPVAVPFRAILPPQPEAVRRALGLLKPETLAAFLPCAIRRMRSQDVPLPTDDRCLRALLRTQFTRDASVFSARPPIHETEMLRFISMLTDGVLILMPDERACQVEAGGAIIQTNNVPLLPLAQKNQRTLCKTIWQYTCIMQKDSLLRDTLDRVVIHTNHLGRTERWDVCLIHGAREIPGVSAYPGVQSAMIVCSERKLGTHRQRKTRFFLLGSADIREAANLVRSRFNTVIPEDCSLLSAIVRAKQKDALDQAARQNAAILLAFVQPLRKCAQGNTPVERLRSAMLGS